MHYLKDVLYNLNIHMLTPLLFSYAEYIFIVSPLMQAISRIRNDSLLEVYKQEYEEL